MKGTGRLVGCFAAALGVAACGNVASNAHGGGDGGLTADQACAMLAQAECGKRDSCSKGTSITRVYGEMSVCLTRSALQCTSPAGGTQHRRHATDSQQVCRRLRDAVVQRLLRRQTADGLHAVRAGRKRAVLRVQRPVRHRLLRRHRERALRHLRSAAGGR